MKFVVVPHARKHLCGMLSQTQADLTKERSRILANIEANQMGNADGYWKKSRDLQSRVMACGLVLEALDAS